MNSNLAPEPEVPATTPAPHAAALRWLPALVIVAAAFAYYGSYWHYWFNPHDEGGTACLIAQRLLQGERPWVDVELGYNIGWFYPLIALFKITGVNYLAARAWFFALSTITALLGCYTVTRISGSRWLGLAVGLVLVALPGSQFKNYIPLAQAANTACLIALAFVGPMATRRWFGVAALGGVVLGLTFLVRIELGFFFSLIWLGVLLFSLLDRRAAFRQRFVSAVLGVACLAGGVLAACSPAYFHLRSQNLEGQFLGEYSSWFSFLEASLKYNFLKLEKPKLMEGNPGLPPDPDDAPVPAALPAGEATVALPSSLASGEDRTALLRRPLSETWTEHGQKRLLPFLTYAPFIGFGAVLLAGLIALLRAVWRRAFQLDDPSMLWLLLAGASLTTFPQFFFFRPDRPHLSEFMTGYIVALTASAWLLWPRGPERPALRRAFAALLALFFLGQAAVFATFATLHPSAGTIAARIGRKAWFHGENGVDVREFKRQATSLQGIHDAVLKAAGPDDYVVCFPYMPGYNVMTNRRTYLRNVYVDNATRSAAFSRTTIADFESKKPAVVIIDDRAINGADASRFSHWAPKVHQWLKTHYASVGVFETVEVFARLPAE